MDTVKLKVTTKVLAQTQRANNQQQIALTEPSGILADVIESCNKRIRLKLKLGDALALELGDTGAIWRAHNKNDEAAFDSLFNFLSSYPDKEFTFVCALTPE